LTIYFETDRMVLRDWSGDDLAPFAAMNADQKVMEFYPATISREESDTLAMRLQQNMDAIGFGLYAAEVKSTGSFVGYVGISEVGFTADFAPALEIGWRLAAESWGQGYATEAAKACLAHAFSELEFPDLVSFTTRGNKKSIAVMERIGMSRNPDDDFEHPNLPAGHPLRPHVLYRIGNPSTPNKAD
jgi:ribosomal-protein-alanine N-acetyltransferase